MLWALLRQQQRDKKGKEQLRKQSYVAATDIAAAPRYSRDSNTGR
jgi:hypothetical protein